MEGIAVIVYPGGWACTNDAVAIPQRHIVDDGKGARVSVEKNVLRMMNYFCVEGNFEIDQQVDLIFKTEDKKCFEAKVFRLTPEMAILEIIKETNKEIKIGGHNYGK